MTRRTYTDDERRDALALYETDGPRAVEAQMGIPAGTVVGWARANGVQTRSIETASAATRRSVLTMAQRRAELAAGLMDDIDRLRGQLFAPCVERKAVVLNQGGFQGQAVEVVDVQREQPTFGDQKAIMTSLAIAVDKVLLLTGEATSRTEVVTTGPIEAEIARLEHELGIAS